MLKFSLKIFLQSFESLLLIWCERLSMDSNLGADYSNLGVEISTRYTELKKLQLYEKFQPGLKYNSLG